jgi:hypothetical protein
MTPPFRLLCALVVAGGCSRPVTELVVYVHSAGLTVPDQIDQVQISVTDRTSNRLMYKSPSQPLCSPTTRTGCYDLPIGLTLYPGPRSPTDAVEVRVQAQQGAVTVVDDAALFTFASGVRQELDFSLYASCLGSSCATSDPAHPYCAQSGACGVLAPMPLATHAPDLGGGDAGSAIKFNWCTNSAAQSFMSTMVSPSPGTNVIAPGDFLMAVVVGGAGVVPCGLDLGPITAPAGWTAIDNLNGFDTGTGLRTSAFWKIAGASEPSAYELSWAKTSCALAYTLVDYSNVRPLTPIDASGLLATGTYVSSITAPSITLASPADLLVGLFMDAGVTAVAPTEMTRRCDTLSNATTRPEILIADQPLSSAGPTGPRVADVGPSVYHTTVGALLGLAPGP